MLELHATAQRAREVGDAVGPGDGGGRRFPNESALGGRRFPNESAVGGAGGGAVGGLLRLVEELEDALGRRHAGDQHVGHAGDLPKRLVELARVLDERGHGAEGHLPVGHAQAADHRDAHVAQPVHPLHDRHDHPRVELRRERGLVQLLVALVEARGHVPLTAEHGHQLVPRERLLDVPVEPARLPPLRGEERLGLLADHAHHHTGHRQGDQGDERELPGQPEHHADDADHGQHRVHERGERLLEGLLDVVHVVGGAGEQVAALPAVEVTQRQPVDLGLDLLAQAEDDAHDDVIEHAALQPHEGLRHQVHAQDDEDQPAQLGEVDPLARRERHAGEHLCGLVLALGAQPVDDLLAAQPAGHLRGDHAAEDHVHRPAQDVRGPHVEHDGDQHHQRDHHQAQLLRAEQAHEPLRGRPERLGLAGRPAAPVVGGALLLDLEDLLVRQVLAHATSSAVSWESTISR